MKRIILLGAAMGALLVTTTAVSSLSAKPVRGCHPVDEKREYGKPRQWIPLETLSQALASKRAKIDGYMLVIDGACIDALGDMSALKGIQLLGIYNSHIGSLRDMRTLTNLKRLSFDNVVLRDKRVFSYVPNPERHRQLRIKLDRVADLRFLARMSNLEKVFLELKHHGSLAALGKLSNLRELYLVGQFRDVSFLSSLTRLRELTISSSRLVDIRGLGPLVELRSLTIGASTLADIRPLGGLTKVERLVLLGDGVRNFAPLATMRGLEVLGLQWARITSKTFPWHAQWPKIEAIRMLYNRNLFGDALPFARFRSLRLLRILPQRLENVEALRKLLPLLRVEHDARGMVLRCSRSKEECHW